MKKLLEYLKTMFASKNIELTAEEQTRMYESMIDAIGENKPLPADIKIPDNLQHNANFIKELQTAFQSQTEALAKKNEEQISALMSKNEELLKMLGEERTKREEGLKAVEAQAQKDRAAKIEAVIAEMVKTEKIPANNEELKAKYTAMLDKDFDTTKAIIDAIPAKTPEAPKNVDGATNKIATGFRSPLASIANPEILRRVEENLKNN